jgi:hypothetical protein
MFKEVDRERTDFLRKYFRVEWPDRAVYHTMIDTAIGGQAVLEIILDLANTLHAGVCANPGKIDHSLGRPGFKATPVLFP